MSSEEQSPSLDRLEARLGVRFANPHLLEQALMHRSYLNERPELGLASNERLEFLGDAVIGLVVADVLYDEFPAASEGDLTRLRAALVRRETLASAATSLGLGEWLRLGRGERKSSGHHRPKALAAVFEAVVAAIARDQGLEKAREFVQIALAADIERVLATDIPLDAKSRLQQLLQARGQPAPTYRVTAVAGPEHEPQFIVQVEAGGLVLGEARARSKRRAEEAAAKAALTSLEAADADTATG